MFNFRGIYTYETLATFPEEGIEAYYYVDLSTEKIYTYASGVYTERFNGGGGSLPTGGTTGQILTKVDATDYNATWQENYAEWTSVVKHTVKNDGTGLITKGTAVYATGSNGTNMLVGKASNTSEATSSKTMGLMQSDITTTGGTQTGFVITEGLLGGLNTAGQTAGDAVWLGVNGALIYGLVNKPYAPAHLVFIGIVTKVSAGSGEIFVKVQNGFELKEIHDVDLITNAPTNNQGLIYESSSSLWKNKTIDKTLVGIGNVDNTSDINKPVSTATQTALNGKEPTITAGTTSQYYRGDKTFQTLDKTAVGLANVDNTSDANKPVSTATQTALNNINSQYTGFLIQNSLTTTTQFAPYAFGGLFATATQVANRLYIAPFILKEDIITNKLSTEVTTLGVLASFYIGVYELDANYFPTGTPVISSTALSGTTIGLKTYTLGSNYTLVKNKWYGMAILSNVTIITRALPSINYLGTQVTSNVNNNTMTRDITAGFTALPSGASMTALSNVPIGVYLQKA